MAKNFRRILATTMVMSMLVSALPMQALAAEDDTITATETISGGDVTITFTPTENAGESSVAVSGTNESGATVDLGGSSTTTTETTTDSNGTVTESTSTEVKLTGTETTADGTVKDVTYQDKTTDTTITETDGTVTEKSVNDGSETKVWDTEEDNLGDPSVKVEIVPGQTTTGIVKVEGSEHTETTTVGSTVITDTSYEVDRTVTATTSKAEVTVNDTNTGLVGDQEAVLTGPAPVYDPEDGPATDAAGKEGVFDRNHLSSQKENTDRVIIGDIVLWINQSTQTVSSIYVPEDTELPEDFEYNVGANVKAWYTNSKGKVGDKVITANLPEGYTAVENAALNDINNWYVNGNIIMDIPDEGEFMYVGTGEHSKYYAGFVTVIYKKDETTGETVLDEDGNPVIEKLTNADGETIMVNGEPCTDLNMADFFNTYNGARATNFMLMDKNGNRVYAYCCDIETGTVKGTWYSVSNLEDSDYYGSEESEEHIRTIALNGYWGTSDVPDENGNYAMGSLESIKEKLKEAINDGTIAREYETYVYSECECNGTCSTAAGKTPCPGGKLQYDENGNPVSIKYDMLELIEGLTAGEALLATQTAIWSFANGSLNALNGVDGIAVLGEGFRNNLKGTSNEHEPLDNEGNARAEFLYKWLIALEAEEESTIIINEKNFVEDVSLSIGDKVSDAQENADDNQGNDIYNADLNFKLAFIPGANDDLLVQITYTDLEGNDVTVVRRLAGENGEGQSYATIQPEEDGSYVLKGLQLSENKDFNFDLRLEGTQYLENGVYVYQAVGGRDVSQTFVGVAEGTRNVDVSIGVTIKFDVDENNHVVAERTWHSEYDPSNTPPSPPEYPPEPANYFEEVPPQIFRLNNQDGLETIPEEPVPLAAPVITGDGSALWMAVVLMAMVAMVAINLNDKKQRSF